VGDMDGVVRIERDMNFAQPFFLLVNELGEGPHTCRMHTLYFGSRAGMPE